MMSAIFNKLELKTQQFAKDTSGSILPIMGVLLVVLVVIAGSGIDYSRSANERTKIANALDAAAITVASKLSSSVMTDDEVDEAIADAFSANLPDSDYKDSAISNLQYELDSDAGTIRIWSNIAVPNMFISAGGIGPDAFTVGVESVVNYSRFDVELALVLDVTGSMSGEIGDLREAASELVETLIPEGTIDGKVRISVVPYSVGVNLGTYADDATDGESNKCATERIGDEQYTDASYTVEPIGDGSGTYRDHDCSDSLLLPLTDDRDDLLDNIDDLTTRGYTAGQTGIGWGWYTLSPNWSGLWPMDSAPASYGDSDVLKFAVVMTDGAFNTYYTQKTWTKKQCNKQKNKGKYTGSCKSGTNTYWVEKSSSGFNGTSSKRGKKLCNAMDNAGIQIYGVYFGDDSSSDGAKVMEDCASSSSTYIHAADGDDLISAFSKIANEIQSIYLSK